jgi:hypothetical protein
MPNARFPADSGCSLRDPCRSALRPNEASKAAVCYVRFTEGFRTAALCRRAGFDAGPASESLVRRKPRGGRGAVWLARPMGILRLRPERSLGFEGWWRALFWAGTTTTSFLEGEDARAWRERGAWREIAEVVRTSRSCSGAWLETKTIGAAWREARRLS